MNNPYNSETVHSHCKDLFYWQIFLCCFRLIAFIIDISRSPILAVSCRRFSNCSHSSATICRLILGFYSNLDKILILISPSSNAVSPCIKIKHLNISRVSSLNLLHVFWRSQSLAMSNIVIILSENNICYCWAKRFCCVLARKSCNVRVCVYVELFPR